MSASNIPGPANSREAAIKILLGDIGPLYTQAGDIAKQLSETQEMHQFVAQEFNADAKAMGESVARFQLEADRVAESCTVIQANFKQLEAQILKLQSPAARPALNIPEPSAMKRVETGRSVAVPALAVALVLALASSAFLLYERYQDRNTLAAGKAVLGVWEKLPDVTRKLIQGTGSN